MVNKLMNNSLKILIEELVNTTEVIEFKRLEKLILENEEVSLKLSRLHDVEKQAVNAKELGLENTYFAYKKEYDEIIKSFEEDVLISSYLNKKEEVLSLVNLVTSIIENEIKKAESQFTSPTPQVTQTIQQSVVNTPSFDDDLPF